MKRSTFEPAPKDRRQVVQSRLIIAIAHLAFAGSWLAVVNWWAA